MALLNADEQKQLENGYQIGNWKYEICEGGSARLYCDTIMNRLLGIEEEMSAAERLDFYKAHVLDADLEIVTEYIRKLSDVYTEIEYRYNHPKLGLRMVRCSGLVSKAEDGMVTLIGMHQDITDAVQMHYHADKTDRTLSQIAQILYGYTLVLNVNTGKYTLIVGSGMEQSVEVFRQYSDYQVAIRHLMSFVDPAFHEQLLNLIDLDQLRAQQRGNGHLGSLEYPICYPGEEACEWHEINVFSEINDVGSPMIHLLGRDVTKVHNKADTEAQLEIATKSNEAKTAFLFHMSHDIRTPMNAIMGFTELLDKHQEDPIKRQDYLAKIRESSDVLLSIINNVLEMARIEKGATALTEAAWNAKELMQSICTVFKDMMQEKNITFMSGVCIEHEYIFCDVIKLREILINFLSNAHKYTQPGGRVSFIVEELPSEQEGYAIYQTTIEDTGIGMSEDYIPHLFEEFTREHTTTENKVQGTGLGMPIVKKLLDLMGGTVDVESALGEGSKFVVTIQHRIAQKSDLLNVEQEQVTEKNLAGRRILLAEDNDLNAEIAIEILSESGFVVERAENGKICFDLLSNAPMGYYDLILMDIQMPVMDGYEATRQIRRMIETDKAWIPIIAMTANAFEEDRKEAIACGMNGHLAKPIIIRDLLDAINAALD